MDGVGTPELAAARRVIVGHGGDGRLVRVRGRPVPVVEPACFACRGVRGSQFLLLLLRRLIRLCKVSVHLDCIDENGLNMKHWHGTFRISAFITILLLLLMLLVPQEAFGHLWLRPGLHMRPMALLIV